MIAIKKLSMHSVVLIIASLALQSNAHQGSHDDAPITACKEKKLANLCEYSNHAGDMYRGTCRSFSDTLMCVRNKPVIKAKKTEVTGENDQYTHAENSEAPSAKVFDEKNKSESEMLNK